MKPWTMHQINLIAKCLGFSTEAILYETSIVEKRSLYPSTPTGPLDHTPNHKPPMALYTLVPLSGGNRYYVYIADRLSFCYYEEHNKYIAYI